jgi:DNA-binding response OmpR family regulator
MESRKVLVVDDDITISEMLKLGLEVAGYSVETVSDEASLWKNIYNIKPDIILMDIGMPGIDGISLCRKVRLSKGLEKVPVIMVSAFSDNSTFHDAMLFGANDFLVKPFNIDDVKKKMEALLVKAT